MEIISQLDVVMAQRKISVNELSRRIDISPVNISRIRTGNIKAIRFSTLMKLCSALDCQPGDLFEFSAETGDFEFTPGEKGVKDEGN